MVLPLLHFNLSCHWILEYPIPGESGYFITGFKHHAPACYNNPGINREMKQKEYQPDHSRITAACRNTGTAPFPLYEHNVSIELVEAILGRELKPLALGDLADRTEFFRIYAGFLATLGYDTVPFEGCIVELVQGGEALCGRAPALMKTRADVEDYDWEGTVERYFERFTPSFRALAAALPPGMKAHGGVGNGIFETIQDFVPLTEIAYMQVDDPEARALLVQKVGDLMDAIWNGFWLSLMNPLNFTALVTIWVFRPQY